MGRWYKIVTGDTLWAIAKTFKTTPEAIQNANPDKIPNINDIKAGDTIYIP